MLRNWNKQNSIETYYFSPHFILDLILVASVKNIMNENNLDFVI